MQERQLHPEKSLVQGLPLTCRVPTGLVPMTIPPSTINIKFCHRLTAHDYATAILACQHALTMAGFGELATVRPDGTASDEQINEVADDWAAASPWSS